MCFYGRGSKDEKKTPGKKKTGQLEPRTVSKQMDANNLEPKRKGILKKRSRGKFIIKNHKNNHHRKCLV